MMKNIKNQKPQRGGFTLVEVMIVLFILVMIGGFAVVAIQGQRATAQKRTALAYTKMLSTQVKSFDGIASRLPTTAEGLTALVVRPADLSEANWGGPYLESFAVSRDPWGNEYQYISPGKDGRPYDIWSFGPDGMDGTDDDIGHWMSINDLK
jgi:general secretion pathway protein G